MSQRYFGAIINNRVILNDDDLNHILKVMRMKINDEIEVVYKEKVHICKIINLKPLDFEVIAIKEENHELGSNVTLIMSLIKGEKLDLVLQKATELGVQEIVLLATSRTIANKKNFRLEHKINRYQKILKEASEQSKRVKIPFLHRLIDLTELKSIKAEHKFIAYECAGGKTATFHQSLKNIKKGESVAVMIGPEGGFANEEVNLATLNGYQIVALGQRILRAETAAIYALSLIASYLERK